MGPQHARILAQALSGLLLAMFVSILSATIVSNALPTIIGELHGSQTQYTWVVTATLLTTTASTPIWGKLSDLFDKKLLVQIAIVIFVVSSAMAGLAQSMGWELNFDLPGHRVSDFPHAAIHTGSLAEFEDSPSAMRWILEIHLRDPQRRFGAFFEDMLLGDEYYR